MAVIWGCSAVDLGGVSAGAVLFPNLRRRSLEKTLRLGKIEGRGEGGDRG